MRKTPFAGIELTSQRVRGLRGTSELPGRPAALGFYREKGSALPFLNLCELQASHHNKLLQNDSSTHPTMYTTKVHVSVVPLVETQLIKCLQAEQITFFPLMVGLNSCITCQIHDLLALLPPAAFPAGVDPNRGSEETVRSPGVL